MPLDSKFKYQSIRGTYAKCSSAKSFDKKKKQHYREPIPVDSKVANGTTGNVLFDTGLNDLV